MELLGFTTPLLMRYTDTGRASFVIIYNNKRLPTVNVWRNHESGTVF